MHGRVLARLILCCAVTAAVFACALVDVPGESPAALAVARSGWPDHVDPLPPGTRMSDPVDTASLYERAGLSRVAARAYRVADSAEAAPPGTPTTRGLAVHVRPSCSGTGTDGRRVQVLYVREADTDSRFRDVLPLIRNEVATVDDVFAVSSRRTGGDLRVRWVHRDCVPVIEEVVVPDGTLGQGLDPMIEALLARGYDDPNRKYLGFADARRLCGVGTYWLDDSAARNANDGYGAAYSRVDTPCWTGSTSTPAHELMHNLGGIQASAPNATRFGHCTDESDLMCYDDGSGAAMRPVCDNDHEQLFDCRGDDYFSTAPPSGSYLTTHWNTARSGFLDPAPVTDPARPAPAAEPDWSEVSERGRRNARLSAVLRDAETAEPLAAVPVRLERRALSGARWGRVATTLTTDESGTVDARVSRRTAGWYRFVYVGTSGRPASSSEPVFVKKAARAGIDWRGRSQKVTGRLVDLRGSALRGERMVLQKRHPGTAWRRIAARTSDREGTVSVRHRVRRTTYFRWVYRGSDQVLGDHSGRIRVRR